MIAGALTGGARQITLPSTTIRLQPKTSIVTASAGATSVQQTALKPIAPSTPQCMSLIEFCHSCFSSDKF